MRKPLLHLNTVLGIGSVRGSGREREPPLPPASLLPRSGMGTGGGERRRFSLAQQRIPGETPGEQGRRERLKSCSRYSLGPLTNPRCPGPAERPRPARDGSQTPLSPRAVSQGLPKPPDSRPAPRSPLPPARPPGCPSQPPPWPRRHPTPSDTCAPGAERSGPRPCGRCPRRPPTAPWGGQGAGAALPARDRGTGDPPPRRAPTPRAPRPSRAPPRGEKGQLPAVAALRGEKGQPPAVAAPRVRGSKHGRGGGRGCFHPAPKSHLCSLN